MKIIRSSFFRLLCMTEFYIIFHISCGCWEDHQTESRRLFFYPIYYLSIFLDRLSPHRFIQSIDLSSESDELLSCLRNEWLKNAKDGNDIGKHAPQFNQIKSFYFRNNSRIKMCGSCCQIGKRVFFKYDLNGKIIIVYAWSLF